MVWLGIALGGGLGAVARYGVGLLAHRWFGPGFPWGTLVVNLAGCFLLGLLMEWEVRSPHVSPETRLILGTGFLGALTTFSTFGVDTFRALEAGSTGAALSNIALNVIPGLLLVYAGVVCARQLTP